eukprot:m.148240 g.148240  ORF g.148240 m.148240 type:complete len:53 (-) comp13250_c2_seq1:4151-4309(-)
MASHFHISPLRVRAALNCASLVAIVLKNPTRLSFASPPRGRCTMDISAYFFV